MTKEELKKYNGKDGMPAYIAYKGKIYDVSNSDFWKNGKHMGRFHAGEDLTEDIDLSPHGEKNIFAMKEVGVLEGSDTVTNTTSNNDPKHEKIFSDLDKKLIARRKWYKKNHPHPISVHFPIGIFAFAFIMQALSILTDGVMANYLTLASFFGTTAAVIFLIPAILSGGLSFYINYSGFANSHLKYKIIFSIVLLITGAVAIFFGKSELSEAGLFSGHAEMLTTSTYNRMKSVYSLFTVINLAVVTFIGFNGGKLTWPDEKK